MAKQRKEPGIFHQLGFVRPTLPDTPVPIDLTRGAEHPDVWYALYPLMRDIVRKLPRLKFAPSGQRRVIAYYQGDSAGIGRLGWCVVSAKWYIVSPRYDKARGPDYTVETKDDARAVREAAWAFRPLSDLYYLTIAARDAEALLGKAAQEIRKNSAVLGYRDVVNFSGGLSSGFYREAKHMLDTGYTFLDANFTEKLRNSVKLYEMEETAKGVKKDKHLYLRGTSAGDMVLVAMIPDLANVTSDVETRRVDPKTLPQWAVDAVNVLSILPVGDYVEGAGFRTGESEFIIPMPKEA